MVDLLTQGRVAVLVCEYRDRIARFGVGLVERLCVAHQTKFVESKTGTDAEAVANAEVEMSKDILAIISVFANRQMGKRGADKVRVVPPRGFKERVAELVGSGLSRRDVVAIIVGEKWRCENTNKPLAERSVRRVIEELRDAKHKAENDGPNIPATVRRFIKKRCVVGAGKRCRSTALYDAYTVFCVRLGANVLGRDKFTEYLKVGVRGLRLENGKVTIARGITLKGARQPLRAGKTDDRKLIEGVLSRD